MAKVTAIVSAYYATEYLEGRLKNLAAQNPRPEIIVVCQTASEEGRIATGLADKILVTQDIPTVYAAWNKGIEAASGEYITNANSDDRLYPGALAALAMALDKSSAAVAYADVDIVSEVGGAPVGRYTWMEGGLAELMTGCFIGPMPMWRKSLHEKHGLFDGDMHSAGDYEFWMRLAAAGETFFHIKQPLGAYLKHPDSVEHRESLRSIWEQSRARAKYRDELWQ